MFTIECLNLPLERKEEIRDIAIKVKNTFYNYMDDHPLASNKLSCVLSKTYSIYKQKYGDNLSKEEKTVFHLYILLPNDEIFNDYIQKYEKNFEQIGMFFNVPTAIVKLRYYLQKNINSEKTYEENKTLKK